MCRIPQILSCLKSLLLSFVLSSFASAWCWLLFQIDFIEHFPELIEGKFSVTVRIQLKWYPETFIHTARIKPSSSAHSVPMARVCCWGSSSLCLWCSRCYPCPGLWRPARPWWSSRSRGPSQGNCTDTFFVYLCHDSVLVLVKCFHEEVWALQDSDKIIFFQETVSPNNFVNSGDTFIKNISTLTYSLKTIQYKGWITLSRSRLTLKLYFAPRYLSHSDLPILTLCSSNIAKYSLIITILDY